MAAELAARAKDPFLEYVGTQVSCVLAFVCIFPHITGENSLQSLKESIPKLMGYFSGTKRTHQNPKLPNSPRSAELKQLRKTYGGGISYWAELMSHCALLPGGGGEVVAPPIVNGSLALAREIQTVSAWWELSIELLKFLEIAKTDKQVIVCHQLWGRLILAYVVGMKKYDVDAQCIFSMLLSYSIISVVPHCGKPIYTSAQMTTLLKRGLECADFDATVRASFMHRIRAAAVAPTKDVIPKRGGGRKVGGGDSSAIDMTTTEVKLASERKQPVKKAQLAKEKPKQTKPKRVECRNAH